MFQLFSNNSNTEYSVRSKDSKIVFVAIFILSVSLIIGYLVSIEIEFVSQYPINVRKTYIAVENNEIVLSWRQERNVELFLGFLFSSNGVITLSSVVNKWPQIVDAQHEKIYFVLDNNQHVEVEVAFNDRKNSINYNIYVPGSIRRSFRISLDSVNFLKWKHEVAQWSRM